MRKTMQKIKTMKKMPGALALRRPLGTLVLAMSGLLLVTACSKKEAAPLNSAKVIRYIGYVNYYPIFIADVKGFFREEFGDEVTFEFNHRMNGGAAAMEAMAAGEVDFAALGDMPIVQARANGLDVQVLSSVFVSTKCASLVAAKGSNIHSIPDLRGKKVAVQGASVQNKLLLKFLEKEHISPDAVDILYMKNRDQLAAFLGNSLDAVVTSVPYTQSIVEQTGAYEVLNAEGYDTIRTYLAASGKFLRQNPDYAVKFLRAIIKANAWIQEHYDETMALSAEEEGIKLEYQKINYETRTFTFNLSEDSLNGLQDTVNYLLAQGTISETLDARTFADRKYITEAQR
ncbi:MAG: ABC transporter substrate-binding protein [Treponema sp.]|nr:ABC transporter substrate-binding protein [Treponema sp.]